MVESVLLTHLQDGIALLGRGIALGCAPDQQQHGQIWPHNRI